MTKNNEGNNKLWWDNLSSRKKIAIVIVILMVIPLVINGLLWFGNYLYSNWNLNISAWGLGNIEWFAFWGSYFGGIATVFAVWWTVNKTEQYFEQTSNDQKRQNTALQQEQERQRRLDVLPLILIQPRIKLTSSVLGILIYQLLQKQKEVEEKDIPLDTLNVYGECDMTEMTVVFGSKIEIRDTGPTEQEWEKVKTKQSCTFIQPSWFINVGRESAINIQVKINAQEQTLVSLHHIFSLTPKERIKLYFLFDIDNDDQEKSMNGKYQFIVMYNDIYKNQYCQKHSLDLNLDDQLFPPVVIDLSISQELIHSTLGNNPD